MKDGSFIQFWRYSSRNREGHAPHPVVAVRNNLILDLWVRGATQDEIADELQIDNRTISRLLQRARRRGDARAVIRHHATLKVLEAAP